MGISVESDLWKNRVGSGSGGRSSSSLMTMMMMRIIRIPSCRRAVGLMVVVDVLGGAVVEVGL